MPQARIGLILMAAGALTALAGVVVWAGGLSWFGRLPGDIRLDRPGMKVYMPFTSLLLVSAAFTVLVNLVQRLMR